MAAKAASSKKKKIVKTKTKTTSTNIKNGIKKKRPALKQKATSSQKSKDTNQEKKQRKKTKKKRGKKSDGLAAEAVRIVEQAASILEEEISAGIVAAKKVEERYVNVNALRSGSSEQVMQRFRNDAHEVLDILLDLVNLSITALGGLSERAMNVRSTTKSKDNENNNGDDSLAELVVPDVLKPGETGKVGMLVENDNESATQKFELSTAGLLNSTGDQLEAKYIEFDPPSLEIAANDLEKVNISVFIPENTPPGQYSGIVQAAAIEMRALLTVKVET